VVGSHRSVDIQIVGDDLTVTNPKRCVFVGVCAWERESFLVLVHERVCWCMRERVCEGVSA